MAKEKNSNEMWGGRFQLCPSDIMTKINASIDIDKRMYKEDIDASVVHCEMLSKQSIITESEAEQIIDGLKKICTTIDEGKFVFDTAYEDIHMNIEHALKELIGDVAGKLHTARSRNDQHLTDFKLWIKKHIKILINKLHDFQLLLIKLSEKHINTILPSFTHLQIAQPTTLAHHFMAYFENDNTRCLKIKLYIM